MIYKTSKEDLLKDGVIRRCEKDAKSVKRLMERARQDIITAERNLKDDPECTFTFSYNALMRCGLALMSNDGFRPDIKDKHINIIKYSTVVLGKDNEDILSLYDYMRRKRNRFTYEPEIPCSDLEAKEAIKTAKEFLEIVEKHIS